MQKSCPANTANKLIASYIKEITAQMNSVQKDFNNMKFENANAKDQIEEIVKLIKSDCGSLINALQSYKFL